MSPPKLTRSTSAPDLIYSFASSSSSRPETSSISINPTQLVHHFFFAGVLHRLPSSSPVYKYYHMQSHPDLLAFINKYYPATLSLFDQLMTERFLANSLLVKFEELIGGRNWELPSPNLTEFDRLYDVHLFMEVSQAESESLISSFSLENQKTPLDLKNQSILQAFMIGFLHCDRAARLSFIYNHANREAEDEVLSDFRSSDMTNFEILGVMLEEQKTNLKMIENFDFSALFVKKVEKLQSNLEYLNKIKGMHEIHSNLETGDIDSLNHNIKQEEEELALLCRDAFAYQACMSGRKEEILSKIECLEGKIRRELESFFISDQVFTPKFC